MIKSFEELTKKELYEILRVRSEVFVVFKGPERPLHEAKITVRFWIVTIIMAALTLMTLKIR